MFLPIGDDVEKRYFPFVTVALIVVNTLIFAAEANVLYQPIDENSIDEYQEEVVDMFSKWGLVPNRVASGDFTALATDVGLVTHMFMHGGLVHLIGNMVVLWAFGYTLEGTFGSAAIFGLYLVWGGCAAACHVLSDTASQIPMVGASGAIAGLIGAYTLAFGYNTSIKTMFIVFLRPHFINIPASIFGSIWILLQIANSMGADEGVAWFAHIGGFAGGFGTMLFLRKKSKSVLVEHRGVLTLCDREELADDADEVETGPVEVPEGCPYCGHELTDDNRITEMLARCPNENCGRMVDLTEEGLACAARR